MSGSCALCGAQGARGALRRCDPCRELEDRIRDRPWLSARVLWATVWGLPGFRQIALALETLGIALIVALAFL